MSDNTDAARRLAAILAETGTRVVLAESCTCGAAAAKLGTVAGISACFCGSIVSYRDRSKTDWLQIPREDIETFDAVSEPIAAHMATHVLERTREADYAASITGHLDEATPGGTGGSVFIGLAWRNADRVELYRVVPGTLHAVGRVARQDEAADRLLDLLALLVREKNNA